MKNSGRLEKRTVIFDWSWQWLGERRRTQSTSISAQPLSSVAQTINGKRAIGEFISELDCSNKIDVLVLDGIDQPLVRNESDHIADMRDMKCAKRFSSVIVELQILFLEKIRLQVVHRKCTFDHAMMPAILTFQQLSEFCSLTALSTDSPLITQLLDSEYGYRATIQLDELKDTLKNANPDSNMSVAAFEFAEASFTNFRSARNYPSTDQTSDFALLTIVKSQILRHMNIYKRTTMQFRSQYRGLTRIQLEEKSMLFSGTIKSAKRFLKTGHPVSSKMMLSWRFIQCIWN